MQRGRTLVRGVVGAAGWGWPWLAVLALSASLAYATDAALTGGHLVPEVSTTVSAPTAADSAVDFCSAASSPAQYVCANTRIHVPNPPSAGVTPGPYVT